MISLTLSVVLLAVEKNSLSELNHIKMLCTHFFEVV